MLLVGWFHGVPAAARTVTMTVDGKSSDDMTRQDPEEARRQQESSQMEKEKCSKEKSGAVVCDKRKE